MAGVGAEYDDLHLRPGQQLATATYPNGLQSIFNYDQLNRLTAMATPVSGYTFQLGPTGNRTSAAGGPVIGGKEQP